MFTTTYPPNLPTSNTPGLNLTGKPSYSYYYATDATSYHPGGLNFAFCDGSVRFIKNTIQSWTFGTAAADSYGDAIPDGTTFNATTYPLDRPGRCLIVSGSIRPCPPAPAARSSAPTRIDGRPGVPAQLAIAGPSAGATRRSPTNPRSAGGRSSAIGPFRPHSPRAGASMRTRLSLIALLAAGALVGCGGPEPVESKVPETERVPRRRPGRPHGQSGLRRTPQRQAGNEEPGRARRPSWRT